MSREGEAMFGNGTATATHSLSSPRMRGIQYAAASPLPRWRLWNTGSRGRVEPGDDEKWRSNLVARYPRHPGQASAARADPESITTSAHRCARRRVSTHEAVLARNQSLPALPKAGWGAA